MRCDISDRMVADGARVLEERISHSFRDSSLLQVALTHKSHFNEQKLNHFNERLEFLGDAVLNIAITEMIMDRLPAANEGLLSKVRSQLVNESYLADVARSFSLGEFLLLGKGEAKGSGRDRPSLLADSLEALIGAIYLDAGLLQVKAFIETHFSHFKKTAVDRWDELLSGLTEMDYKSRLQEFCQQANLGTPRYECILEEGANPSEGPFTMILMIQDREIDRLKGPSKKAATQALAQKLISMRPQTIVDLLKQKGLEASLPPGREKGEKPQMKDEV